MRHASDKKDKLVPVLLLAIIGSTILLVTQTQNALAVVNGVPTVNQIPDQMVDELATLTFNASASDPDGQPLTFSLHNAPYGASINSTSGVFTWTPTEEQGSGVYHIDVVVSDGLVISSRTVMIIVNDVGGGGDGEGKKGIAPSSPGIGSSELGLTNLFADPGNIPLDSTTNLVQESDPIINAKLMSLTVEEPDGDVCAANGLTSDVPVDGLSKQYPNDFTLVTDAGDGICDTGHIGTYYAKSQVNTTAGTVQDSTEFQTDSPFVLPESPVGLIALMASSLAALGGFMLIRGRSARI